MTNLALSTVCNQGCPYCFTVDHRNGSHRGPEFLAIGDLALRLDFLKRSRIEQVRLMGGEPTLHPQFVEIVERARAEGFKILVFSNGLISEEILSYLAGLPEGACNVLVNVNDPAMVEPAVHARRLAAIRQLGRRAMLGFNIYRLDFRLGFLLPIVEQSGCQPSVRLGMAQPCLSGDNQHIHPNQYVFVGAQIARFARAAARAGVSVEFDCGFVRCMFAEADLASLRAAGANVGWRCNPILDVDVSGRVIHCYPLSQLGSLALGRETDAAGLRAAFEARTRLYRQAGVFQECSTCPLKASGECPGGCLAVTMRRFRHTPFAVPVPLQEVRA